MRARAASKLSRRSSANMLSRLTSTLEYLKIMRVRAKSLPLYFFQQEQKKNTEQEKKELIKDGYKNNYYGFCLLAEILLFYALVPIYIACKKVYR